MIDEILYDSESQYSSFLSWELLIFFVQMFSALNLWSFYRWTIIGFSFNLITLRFSITIRRNFFYVELKFSDFSSIKKKLASE